MASKMNEEPYTPDDIKEVLEECLAKHYFGEIVLFLQDGFVRCYEDSRKHKKKDEKVVRRE